MHIKLSALLLTFYLRVLARNLRTKKGIIYRYKGEDTKFSLTSKQISLVENPWIYFDSTYFENNKQVKPSKSSITQLFILFDTFCYYFRAVSPLDFPFVSLIMLLKKKLRCVRQKYVTKR